MSIKPEGRPTTETTLACWPRNDCIRIVLDSPIDYYRRLILAIPVAPVRRVTPWPRIVKLIPIASKCRRHHFEPRTAAACTTAAAAFYVMHMQMKPLIAIQATIRILRTSLRCGRGDQRLCRTSVNMSPGRFGYPRDGSTDDVHLPWQRFGRPLRLSRMAATFVAQSLRR